MSAIPPLPHHICFALYSANLAMAAAYKRLLDPLGLTYPQFITLITLWKKDSQTVGEIGRQLYLETNTLTPLLKRLEVMGLITRQRDTADERQVRISLTAMGQQMEHRADTIPGCIMSATGLTVGDLTMLTTSIASLRDQLLTA